jgi:hypothetical protein
MGMGEVQEKSQNLLEVTKAVMKARTEPIYYITFQYHLILYKLL